MYQIISGLSLLILLVYFIRKIITGKLQTEVFKSMFQDEIEISLSTFKPGSDLQVKRLEAIRRLSLGITAILFILLALSGFFPVVFLGMHLTGWLLIFHVTVAPFFVLSLAFTALLYAKIKQYSNKDVDYLKGAKKTASINVSYLFWSKTGFWLFLLFSLPAVFSILLSMYPVFGTYGQHFLLAVHQYSVLMLFIISTVVFLFRWSVYRN